MGSMMASRVFEKTFADTPRTMGDSVIARDAPQHENIPSHSVGNLCSVDVSGPGCLTWTDDHFSFSERMRVYSETINSVPFPYVDYVPRQVGSTEGFVGQRMVGDLHANQDDQSASSSSGEKSDFWELVSSEPDEHHSPCGSNDGDPHGEDDDHDSPGHHGRSDSDVGVLEMEIPIETASTASSQGSIGQQDVVHTPCSNVDTHSVVSLEVECVSSDIANLNDVESSCSSQRSSPCKSPCQPLMKRMRYSA